MSSASPTTDQSTRFCANGALVQLLRRAAVPSTAIESVRRRLRPRRLGRRQILYTEGAEATQLLAIHSGKVKLVRVNSGGREQVTDVLEAGDLFGFEAVFGTHYDTGAETLTDCELCCMARPDVERLLTEFPRLAVYLAEYLYHQLARTRERQTSLGALTAVEKFAAYLIHGASHNAHAGVRFPLVAQHLTLKELGGILGLSPETVCRVRSELVGQGIIEMSDNGMRVLDMGALRRMADL